MLELRPILSKLVPGDFIHGRCPDGPTLICLVESIDFHRIQTRSITTQRRYTFDVDTGLTNDDGVLCTIDSIAPLPLDVHHVLLGLDRRMRLGELPPNRAEIEALIFINHFYPAHPLQVFKGDTIEYGNDWNVPPARQFK